MMCLKLFSCQKIEKVEKQFDQKIQHKIEDAVKRDDLSGRIHLLFRSVDEQNWDATHWAWKITKFKYVNKFFDRNLDLK